MYISTALITQSTFPPISGSLLFWKICKKCWASVQQIHPLPTSINSLQEILYIYIWGGLLVIRIFFPSHHPAVGSAVFFFSPSIPCLLPFPHSFPSLVLSSLPVSHDPDRRGTRENGERSEMYWTCTRTQTSVVSIFSSALSATFPSPGHPVPRDAGKSPDGAKLTWQALILNVMWHVCKCEEVGTCAI